MIPQIVYRLSSPEESEENGNATDSAGSGSPGDDTEASTSRDSRDSAS